MARRRQGASVRPRRPDPICEDCGAEIWWAWGIDGKVWTPLAPFRFPLASGDGTYEVWKDQHGSLLTRYLTPGARGVQEQSWRGSHHNAACGRWRFEVSRALAHEVKTAVPALDAAQLHELDRALAELRARIAKRAQLLDVDGDDL